MNKKILIAIVIVAIILVGFIAYLSTQKKSPATTATTTTPQPTQPALQNAAADFVKAMQGTGSVKCTYSVNGVESTSYIKDGKIKFETTVKGITNNSIMVNKIVYSWATGSKTGFMIDTSTISTTITPGAGTQNYKSVDSIKSDLEGYKPKCSNEAIADSMFEKPTDVTFSDLSKMMNDIKSNIPANVTIPAGYKIPGQ
jgi:Tfp pilus assembly protein PilV